MQCSNRSWRWLNMIISEPHCKPWSPETPSPWQRAHEGYHVAQADATGLSRVGMMLSGQECPDAKAQPEITFDLCRVLETSGNPPTAPKHQALPGQIPPGFQTCAIPRACPASAPDSWRTQVNALWVWRSGQPRGSPGWLYSWASSHTCMSSQISWKGLWQEGCRTLVPVCFLCSQMIFLCCPRV